MSRADKAVQDFNKLLDKTAEKILNQAKAVKKTEEAQRKQTEAAARNARQQAISTEKVNANIRKFYDGFKLGTKGLKEFTEHAKEAKIVFDSLQKSSRSNVSVIASVVGQNAVAALAKTREELLQMKKTVKQRDVYRAKIAATNVAQEKKRLKTLEAREKRLNAVVKKSKDELTTIKQALRAEIKRRETRDKLLTSAKNILETNKGVVKGAKEALASAEKRLAIKQKEVEVERKRLDILEKEVGIERIYAGLRGYKGARDNFRAKGKRDNVLARHFKQIYGDPTLQQIVTEKQLNKLVEKRSKELERARRAREAELRAAKLQHRQYSANLKNVQRMHNSVRGFLDTMYKINRVLISLSLPTVGFMVSNIINSGLQNLAELQLKLAEIRTITFGLRKSLGGWFKSVLSVSNATGYAVGDVAQAIYETQSNQIAQGEATIGFLKKAATFARITGATLKTSVDLLSTGLNAFSKDTTEATKVAASFFKTIQLGRVKSTEMSTTLGRTAPIAYKLGVRMKELNAAIATMTIQGQPMNVATTLLRGILLKLIKPTKSMRDLFHSWGVNSGEAAIQTLGFTGVLRKLNDEMRTGGLARLGELFGRERPMTGFATLSRNNMRYYERVLKRFNNYSMMKSYSEAKLFTEETPGLRFIKLKNEFSNFIRNDITNSLLPTVVKIMDIVKTNSRIAIEAGKSLLVIAGALAGKFVITSLQTSKMVTSFKLIHRFSKMTTSEVAALSEAQMANVNAAYNYRRTLVKTIKAMALWTVALRAGLAIYNEMQKELTNINEQYDKLTNRQRDSIELAEKRLKILSKQAEMVERQRRVIVGELRGKAQTEKDKLQVNTVYRDSKMEALRNVVKSSFDKLRDRLRSVESAISKATSTIKDINSFRSGLARQALEIHGVTDPRRAARYALAMAKRSYNMGNLSEGRSYYSTFMGLRAKLPNYNKLKLLGWQYRREGAVAKSLQSKRTVLEAKRRKLEVDVSKSREELKTISKGIDKMSKDTTRAELKKSFDSFKGILKDYLKRTHSKLKPDDVASQVGEAMHGTLEKNRRVAEINKKLDKDISKVNEDALKKTKKIEKEKTRIQQTNKLRGTLETARAKAVKDASPSMVYQGTKTAITSGLLGSNPLYQYYRSTVDKFINKHADKYQTRFKRIVGSAKIGSLDSYNRLNRLRREVAGNRSKWSTITTGGAQSLLDSLDTMIDVIGKSLKTIHRDLPKKEDNRDLTFNLNIDGHKAGSVLVDLMHREAKFV